ncbi:methyltransferase domain-containing protein [soil metagenome]
MEEHLHQIREQQRASWDKFSGGWKKWDDLTMEFLAPVGDAIVRSLSPNGSHVVLDIAAGTGEPGLTIASMLTDGHVVITDLSENMLEIARENATRRGITNIRTQACDVCELPFDDNTFDSISCRFGFMFFPDMAIATQEMVRVLKPGGKISTAVWNVPEKNMWVTAMMGSINKHLDLPQPPAGAPGIFRCAQDGHMVELFRAAGLLDLEQHEVPTTLNSGTADVYWEMMNDIAAPVVAALATADESQLAAIKHDVCDVVNKRFPHGNVVIDASALVVVGVK